MSRILATGTKGFIGRVLVKQLQKQSHEVVEFSSSSGNVAEAKFWNKLPETDAVIHLAARSFVPDSWDDPTEFLHVNVIGTGHALEYCRKHKARLVFVSAYLYGIPGRLPIQESDPVQPNNPYALSKKLAEQICEFYSSYWEVPVTIIRPFNVFGPGQRTEFLISEILSQVRNCKEIRVKDLEPRRDYIYLDDMVDALIRALNAPDGFNVLNIGSGISYSVREIIDLIQQEAGTNLPVHSDQTVRQQEIPDVKADIACAEKLIGWVPRHSMVDGIANLLKME